MFKGELFRRAAFALVLPAGLLLSVGCEKQESTAPAPAPVATRPATQPAAAAPAAGSVGAEGAMAGLADEARRASQTQPAMPRDVLPGLGDTAPAIPSPATPDLPSVPAPGATPGATPGSVATAPSSPAAEGKTAEAQKLLDQAMQYVKENKYDLAEKALNQLDGMKSSLPAEWAGKIDAARKAVTAAKAGGGVKLPEGIPGLK